MPETVTTEARRDTPVVATAAPATDTALAKAQAPETKAAAKPETRSEAADASPEAAAASLKAAQDKVWAKHEASAKGEAEPEKAATAKRGADGKFVSSDPEKAAAAKEKPEGAIPAEGNPEAKAPEKAAAKTEAKTAEPPKAADAKPVEAPAKPVTAHEPPANWSAAAKEKWAAIDADLQSEIATRTLEQRQAISKLGNDNKALADAYTPFHEVMTKHEASFKEAGVDHPAKFVDAMMQWHQYLRRDPAKALPEFARAYGYDLSKLAPSSPAADDLGLPPDPAVTALKSELAELRRELAETRQSQSQQQQYLTSQQEAARAAEQERGRTFLTSFFADKPEAKDDAFKNRVVTEYQVLSNDHPESSPVDLLNLAYESARWSFPASRQRLIAEKMEAERKALAEAQAKHAETATRAAAVNVTGAPQSRSQKSLAQHYDDVFARHGWSQ